MSIVLPDPDEIEHVPRGTIVKWKCPKCRTLGTLSDGFGLRYMNAPNVRAGIEAPEWRKQSYCYRCRLKAWGVHRVPPEQPYLIDLDAVIEASDAPDDDLPEDPTLYFEGIQ